MPARALRLFGRNLLCRLISEHQIRRRWRGHARFKPSMSCVDRLDAQRCRFRMASPDQLIQQIRFAFEMLSERNAQHEFEHLCRHFARARICFNILPATGPVAGGGDQGRDFETFRTFIHGLGENRFCALAETRKIAFACSLEKKVSAKVKADVANILSGGLPPDVIYFFSSRSVSVSERHKLQEWSRTKFSVELEIVDCNALAEQLADAEVFWIAARYLQVPLEVFPKPEKVGTEYQRLRDKWFAETASPERYADFIEIKRAARSALDDARQDLSRWLSLLSDCESRFSEEHERHQVLYELIAFTMRQRRSLRGEEGRVRAFFNDTSKLALPDIAAEAETIHCYANTAQMLGEADLQGEELDQWHVEILSAIERGIGDPCSQNQLCLWLKLRGRVEMHAQVRRCQSVDFAAIVAPWVRLIEVLPHAPMFPVQDFHDLVVLMSEQLGDPPIFDEILGKLRPFLAERAGDAAFADSHFKRAEYFLDKDQIPRAMRELHAARLKWFREETIGQSAHCCLLLGRCYQRVGLHFAAIHYALAASYIIANAPDVAMQLHVHEGLHDAIESAYAQGHWCLFFEMVGPALSVQFHTTTEGLDPNKSPHLAWLFKNLPMALHATRLLLPTTFDAVMREFRTHGMEEMLLEEMSAVQAAVTAAKWCDGDLALALRNSFTGPPFSDAGSQCEVVWAAHGIRWHIRWDNDYEALRVALEVVAFLQIALAELAGCDLDIVPGTFLANVELTDGGSVVGEPIPDNSSYRWKFKVPRMPAHGTTGLEAFQKQMAVCIVRIVRAISVMPATDFTNVFERELAPHLFANGFFARRFPELLDFFAGRQRFGAIGRRDVAKPLSTETWEPQVSEPLARVKTLHPQYDKEAEMERVRRRYEVSLAGLRHTLPRVVADPAFRTVVDELRSEGWKDWQLLMAMLNTTANFRVAARIDPHADSQAYAVAMNKEVFSPEREDVFPVPISEFSRQMLEMQLLMALGSGLMSDGLELHQRTLNSDGLFVYAKERWLYFDHDIEHGTVFLW